VINDVSGYAFKRFEPQPRPISTMKLLLVDDESLSRAALKELCARTHDLELVGEAASGTAAINAIEELRPEVILVDVELPDMTGFDVLRAAHTAHPVGVMVTAHAEHAVTAFAAGAVDYLLKPVSGERFAVAMRRAREYSIARSHLERNLPEPYHGPSDGAASEPWFLVGEREHRLYPLDPRNIEYVESDGNYVTFHSGASSYISRDSVKRLETLLKSYGFLRIERSLLVNVRAILYLEPQGRGTFAFTLASGSRIHSSATYRDAILQVLPLAPASGRRSPALSSRIP